MSSHNETPSFGENELLSLYRAVMATPVHRLTIWSAFLEFRVWFSMRCAAC